MSRLKLDELDTKLRDRIRRQIAQEDAAKVSSAGVCASDPKPIKRRTLDRDVSRKEAVGPRFEIRFTIFARKPCDWDNYVPGLKYVQDFLVAAGCLLGDGWNILGGRVYSMQVQSVEEERTEIEIVEI